MQMHLAMETPRRFAFLGGLANTGSALNIRVHLRLTVLFWDKMIVP
jgi:hypothetical protein